MFVSIRNLMSKWKWLDRKLEQNRPLDNILTGSIAVALVLAVLFFVLVLPCFFFGAAYFYTIVFGAVLFIIAWWAGEMINEKRRGHGSCRHH